MERTLLGEEGLTSEVEVDGEKYIDITNNPIKLIRLLNEKEKIGSKEGKTPTEKQIKSKPTTEAKKTEKTTVEQYGDKKEIKSDTQKKIEELEGILAQDAQSVADGNGSMLVDREAVVNELNELKQQDAQETNEVRKEGEQVQAEEIEAKKKEDGFTKAGKESKDKGDGKILGKWILDNAKVGDTITDEDGNGYEVIEINRRGDVKIRAFEINENNEKVYLEGADAYRLVSKTMLKQGDLFEYGYTDLDGNRVIKQYKYNAKKETSDSDMSKVDKTGVQDGKETKKEEVEKAKYDSFVKEKYSEVYDEIISSGGSVKDVMFKLDEMARSEGLSKDNILNEDIDKKSELVILSELDKFVGEDRVGSKKMDSSRENIDKLKEDIFKNGFKEPIIVQYTNNGKASIVEGNHRYVAAKELGYDKIPVVFRRVDSLPKNVSSDFVEITPKDNYSKSGKDLGFTSFKIINSDYKQKQLPSKNQQPSSGAKKPQEKQSTAKTATAEQKSKQQKSEGKEESIISKGVTVEGAPEGIYIDVEMIAGKDGRKLTPEEVLDAIPIDGIEFDNDGNNLMIKLPRELTSSEMMSLMKATEQEAIGQLSNGTGKLYAQSKKLLEDYGNEFNEKFFKTPRKEKLKKYEKSTAGNRIFNKPLEAVKEIANNYYERVFGKKRPIFKGITKIDKEFAKRIANAYEAMQNNPNDPEVRAAYKALARETMEQYKEFNKAGFIIEINNKEPYNNSQEMIDDLRENRRIKIFSTESGFGDTPITDKQRKENPLLRDSGKKDANGKPLLINDIFRAIHDFYGHAELGNGFGAIGEENAWNVHARMYSPLARRAMTTETRGQNSWVNFSGINDEAFKKIDRARELRRQGKKAEAQEIVSQIYEMMSFAEQKVGLLPREFSELSLEEGTATAGQKSKQAPRDVKKETEGLTEKEIAKQGVEEIVSAYKQKIKDVKAVLNEKIANAKATANEKIKAINDARKEIIDGIDRLLPKGMKLPKGIVKELNKAKTPKAISNALDRLSNIVDRVTISNKRQDIKSNQDKVRKILPKLTNKQDLVEEFLGIDINSIDDVELLDRINNELNNILNNGVAKLTPKTVEDINSKVEQKKAAKSKAINKDSFERRMKLADEKDSSYSKVRSLDRLLSDLEKTFVNGEIGESDYNEMKSKIASKIDEYSKDAEQDIADLNKDSQERLDKLNESQFTSLQREEIKKLKKQAGNRLDYKNAVKLNDIVTELELGYIPIQQMSEYYIDSKSNVDKTILTEKINARKDFGGKLDRVAKLLGLGRLGQLRESKTTQDAIDILQSLNIGFWDDLFGLGKELTFSGLISNPLDKSIATIARKAREIEKRFTSIKYNTFGSVKEVSDYEIRMARKQGDWEVTDGNDSDYWGELIMTKEDDAELSNLIDKGVNNLTAQERERLEYLRYKEKEFSKYDDREKKLIIKAYENLPKKNGKVAYDVYLENLKGRNKRLNNFYTEIAEALSEYQEIANQRIGKEYKKRDSRYYQTDIVKQNKSEQAADDLNSFIASSMGNYASLKAGVGISRVERNRPVAISLNSERMVARQATQTLRDYYLSEQIKLATKTIGKTKSGLKSKDARIILSQIPEVLRLRLGKEYGIDSNTDAFRGVVHRLLGAARSYFLSGITRVFGAEIISESFRVIGATRIRKLPRSIGQLVFNNNSIKTNSLKKLLDKVDSPFLEKTYLETSAPDATGELGKSRTILNKSSKLVERITSGYIGLSSTITFPLVWLPEFNYRFKNITGVDFDMSKFTKDDKYFEKYNDAIITAASFADTQTERVQGGRTRFSRRQQVSWIGTPIYNLKDLITGSETTSKTSSSVAPKYLDAFSTAGILNSFLSNFAFLEDLNVTRGGRELLFGENLNRFRASRLLVFGMLSGMSYNLAKGYIESLLSDDKDDEDDFWDKEQILNSAINNFMFLKVGRYGQSAKLALLAITSALVMSERDEKKKKKIIELSKDRFQSYPIELGYGSKKYAITNFADQIIPFLGESISTGINMGETIIDNKEEEINMTLATVSLANDMVKTFLIAKGTQLPTQRYQDDMLRALKKIEKGEKISQKEFELLNRFGFIDIIDDAVKNAKVKKQNK
jgi:hypothetical protein